MQTPIEMISVCPHDTSELDFLHRLARRDLESNVCVESSLVQENMDFFSDSTLHLQKLEVVGTHLSDALSIIQSRCKHLVLRCHASALFPKVHLGVQSTLLQCLSLHHVAIDTDIFASLRIHTLCLDSCQVNASVITVPSSVRELALHHQYFPKMDLDVEALQEISICDYAEFSNDFLQMLAPVPKIRLARNTCDLFFPQNQIVSIENHARFLHDSGVSCKELSVDDSRHIPAQSSIVSLVVSGDFSALQPIDTVERLVLQGTSAEEHIPKLEGFPHLKYLMLSRIVVDDLALTSPEKVEIVVAFQ